MAEIFVDSSEFPFVYIRFPPDPSNVDEVRAFVDEQRRLVQRRERFVILVDASQMTVSVATHRKIYAEWLKEADATSGRFCVCVALVIGNAVVRGAMQAVLWVVASPFPIETFTSVAAASRHLADLMEREGLAHADAALRAAHSRVA